MKVVLFANTDWYLYNFRRSLARGLQDAGNEVLLVSPPGHYGEALHDLGFRWVPVPMVRRSLNPLRELILFWHLWDLLRREHPSLVHGFTIKCAVYGAIAARLARVPARVSSVAGMGYVFTSTDLAARLLRPLVRGLMRAALGGGQARLILQNPDDVALFESAGLVDASSIRLIRGSGVDCTRFTLRADSRHAGQPLRVLLAGRLLWDKGLAEFVAAARLLRREGRAIEFLLAGDPDPGNPAAVPAETVRAWHSERLLQWLGHVDDMPELLSSVHLMVLPSYREGLPKSLIEAAACGLPLIATDVPGCREVVSHEVDGLLVPVRDAAALAKAIARLQDDPALARRLGWRHVPKRCGNSTNASSSSKRWQCIGNCCPRRQRVAEDAGLPAMHGPRPIPRSQSAHSVVRVVQGAHSAWPDAIDQRVTIHPTWLRSRPSDFELTLTLIATGNLSIAIFIHNCVHSLSVY